MKERGNDCDAFVSVIASCQQIEMHCEMERLKEERCAKENDKAKGNKLAVPVAARILNALAVTVVDTDPLYDCIVTQSPRKKPRKPSPTPPPLKNDIVIERAKLTGGSFFTTNDEPTHLKTDILEYDTTSSFGIPRNCSTVHQDADKSKLDPKSSNRTDSYAEGLDNFSAKESSLCPSLEFDQFVQDARNSEKFVQPSEREDQSCIELDEDVLLEDTIGYLYVEDGCLRVGPLFTRGWSTSITESFDMNLSSDGSSDSNGEEQEEVTWEDG